MSRSRNFTRSDALTGKGGEIYRYLQQRRGEEVSIHEIAKAVGCDTSTASTNASKFAKVKRFKIRRTRRGVYMCEQPAPSAPRPAAPVARKITGPLLEIVGNLTDGSVVMRDEHGTLHRYAEAS